VRGPDGSLSRYDAFALTNVGHMRMPPVGALTALPTVHRHPIPASF
jgi:hypothetical protein